MNTYAAVIEAPAKLVGEPPALNGNDYKPDVFFQKNAQSWLYCVDSCAKHFFTMPNFLLSIQLAEPVPTGEQD